MTTTLALSLNPARTTFLVLVAALGFIAATPAYAATAQISATPTTITAGQSATLTWNCYGTSASLSQGIGDVSNSGSYAVSPEVTKTYTLTCTDSTSATSASVTITVDNQGCYQDSNVQVSHSRVFTPYSQSNKVIFNEEGSNALNGGGSYDSQNHYQRCINECAAYGKCNYTFTLDYTSSEMSRTRFICNYVSPVSGTEARETEYFYGVTTDLQRETNYYTIDWQASSGGTCEPLPNPPTATLTANPTSVASGGSSTLTWSSTNADSCSGSGFSTGGATSGSKSVSLTATKDFYVTCTNEAGMAQASARVSVGNAPDLIVGSVTPVTATAGQAVTLVAKAVKNQGLASTGAGFRVLYQRATSQNGSNATDLGTTLTTTLAAGGTRDVNFSAGASTFPTAGNWFIRACSDKVQGGDVNGQIVESNESNNCSAWTKVTVVAGATTYPDLTASTPTPGTAVAGSPRNFTSSISNIGAVSTGSSVTNVFHFDNDLNHATIVASEVDTVPAIATGTNLSATVSYTFSSGISTWYVRACADRNASGVGTIIESDESDGSNCSPWRTVTVSAATEGGALSCTSSQSVLADGSTRVVYVADPGIATSFTWTVTPAQPDTPATTARDRWSYIYTTPNFYSVTVEGNNGTSATCPLTTVGNPCSNPALTITAVPDRVNGTSQTSTLTIGGTGISGSCVLNGPGFSNHPIATDMCTVADTVVTTPIITAQSTYTVTCGTQATASAIVNLIPAFQEF